MTRRGLFASLAAAVVGPKVVEALPAQLGPLLPRPRAVSFEYECSRPSEVLIWVGNSVYTRIQLLPGKGKKTFCMSFADREDGPRGQIRLDFMHSYSTCVCNASFTYWDSLPMVFATSPQPEPLASLRKRALVLPLGPPPLPDRP